MKNIANENNIEKNPPKILNPEFVQKVIGLRQEGFNIKEIANQTETSTTTIGRILKRYNVPRPSKLIGRTSTKTSRLPAQQIIQLRKKGLLLKDIAKELNISVGSVGSTLKKYNVPMVLIKTNRGGKRLNIPEQELIEQFLNGKTLKELSALYHVSSSTIATRLKKNGIRSSPTRKKKQFEKSNDPSFNIIYLFQKENKTINEIAQIYHLSRPSVYYYLKKQGLSFPNNYSDIFKETLRLFTEEHKTIQELSRFYNVDPGGIYYRLRKMGIKNFKQSTTKKNTTTTLKKPAIPDLEFIQLVKKEHKTVKELSAIYNVTPVTIYKRLEKLNLSISTEPKKELEKAILKLYNEGKSVYKIAEMQNLAPTTIYRLLKANNIIFRKKKGD